MEENNMKEKKTAKSLLEMNCEEAERIIEERKNNEDSLVSQIQFGRFARHCLNCKECDRKAKEVGLLVSGKS